MRSIENKEIWFSRDLESPWSVGDGFIRSQTLPIYCYVKQVPQAQNEKRLLPHDRKHKAERYFFAIEPALKDILEAPFKWELRCAKEELRSTKELAHVERGRALLTQKLLDARCDELANTVAEITAFQGASLFRRLWIALRPVKNWPHAAQSTAQQPTP
jgi:hypothetical protein